MSERFTKKFLEELATTSGRIEAWDTLATGLGIRVSALNRKTFCYRYAFNGTLHRVTLGGFPAMTLEKAREKAVLLRQKVMTGEPPHLDEAKEESSAYFRDFAEIFMNRHVLIKLRPSTIKSYRWVLNHYLIPSFGPMRMAEIQMHHIEEWHAVSANVPRTANLGVSILSVMMRLAEQWGHRTPNTNPCIYLSHYPEDPRERPLDIDEVRKLWELLDNLDASGSESAWLTGAIRFAVLTGMRKSEIVELTWREVNLEGKTIRIPDHKTSRRFGARIVPISPEAHDLLVGLPRKPGSVRVFPGQRAGAKLAIDEGWKRIRAMVGLDDVHFHDLRHTFGTLAGKVGVPLRHIGGALGQQEARTTQRYAHNVLDSVREAPDAVGRQITKATKPK